MKYIIRGGTVHDGLGNAPVQADVLVQNDKIVAIGSGLSQEDAAVIDAAGCLVTPGFVDIHRHSDVAPLRDANFGELELAQGITSIVAGNCGLAPVPMAAEYMRESCDFLEPVVGRLAPQHTFAQYADYYAALQNAAMPVNMGALAGAGAIKTAIKGFTDAPYTTTELQQAEAYVQQAINNGAMGVSLGIMYQPECYSTTEDLAQVVRPVAKVNGVVTTHIRGEGDSLVRSVAEVIEIAKKAGVRLHISHFKATGISNWNSNIYKAIACIEEAWASGMEVTADFYPYNGGATTLLSLIPPNILHGGGDATLQFLSTQKGKDALRSEIYKKQEQWDNMALSIGWDRILISSTTLPEHAAYGGRNIAVLAAESGYEDPSDFVCDLLVSEGGRVGIIVLSMDQNDIDAVAKLPYTAVISDALYDIGANPHPRLYGSFPKIIREYVRERGVLTMENAIYKMTGYPAQILRLENRGRLKEGYHADLNIFNPALLRDNAVYTDSKKLSTGMEWVFVNGVPAFHNGKKLEQNAGRVLHRG